MYEGAPRASKRCVLGGDREAQGEPVLYRSTAIRAFMRAVAREVPDHYDMGTCASWERWGTDQHRSPGSGIGRLIRLMAAPDHRQPGGRPATGGVMNRPLPAATPPSRVARHAPLPPRPSPADVVDQRRPQRRPWMKGGIWRCVAPGPGIDAQRFTVITSASAELLGTSSGADGRPVVFCRGRRPRDADGYFLG